MAHPEYSKKPLTEPSELLLFRMMEEVQDYAIILLDPTGIILNWNRGAANIKGYSDSEVIGKSFRIFYTKEDQEAGLPDKLLKEAIENGKAVYEGWRIRKDKTMFWSSTVLTALHNDREIIGFSKVTRDLTERKTSEDLIRAKNTELEAMNQELASFAYVASHDLQEPLRKIQTFLSRIEEMEKDRLSERSIDFFARIQSAASRMQSLIDDLLAYSRTTTDQRKFEQVDLNELIRNVQKSMHDSILEKNSIIELGQLPAISGVRFQLQQLFTNLLSNSLKFSKNEVPSRIWIRYELISGNKIEKHGSDFDKKFHHIEVKDNGIGFESEFNSKVFDLFQRLHSRAEYPGTGMGLAICKKIVENHKGFVKAEGHKDMGASFHIYFPAKE